MTHNPTVEYPYVITKYLPLEDREDVIRGSESLEEAVQFAKEQAAAWRRYHNLEDHILGRPFSVFLSSDISSDGRPRNRHAPLPKPLFTAT